MSDKEAHQDNRVFDYLNRTMGAEETREFETHLKDCEECSSLAVLIRGLKRSASILGDEESDHPGVREIASYFYNATASTERSLVAVHVARCSLCAETVALYARAQRAAIEFQPSNAVQGEVPATAWAMIRDWEQSSFAQLKPAHEVLGHDLLSRLAGLFNEQVSDVARQGAPQSRGVERVPVFVVTKSGDVRGIEFFEREVDSSGASILKHAGGSQRFDNKQIHALLDIGEKEPVVLSELVNFDTVRLVQSNSEERPRSANFFIIED